MTIDHHRAGGRARLAYGRIASHSPVFLATNCLGVFTAAFYRRLCIVRDGLTAAEIAGAFD